MTDNNEGMVDLHINQVHELVERGARRLVDLLDNAEEPIVIPPEAFAIMESLKVIFEALNKWRGMPKPKFVEEGGLPDDK